MQGDARLFVLPHNATTAGLPAWRAGAEEGAIPADAAAAAGFGLQPLSPLAKGAAAYQAGSGLLLGALRLGAVEALEQSVHATSTPGAAWASYAGEASCLLRVLGSSRGLMRPHPHGRAAKSRACGWGLGGGGASGEGRPLAGEERRRPAHAMLWSTNIVVC